MVPPGWSLFVSQTPISSQPRPFGHTERPDAWWLQPLLVLLGGYTLGCHSLRHLVGGRLGKFRRSDVQLTMPLCDRILTVAQEMIVAVKGPERDGDHSA